MKASLYIGALFVLLYAWFWMVDALVARGTDERPADENGLPQVEVLKVMDGVDGVLAMPKVRR